MRRLVDGHPVTEAECVTLGWIVKGYSFHLSPVAGGVHRAT